MKTLEDLKGELKSAMAEFFGEVEKRMDLGETFQTAVMSVCKSRPDLTERENSLRDHLKALGSIEQSLSAGDIQAWYARKGAGVISYTATRGGPPQVGLSLALADLRSKLARLPLAILGTWYKGPTKFSLTRQDMADAVKNFRKRQADLVIDYEHASEAPQVAAGGPIPAAGWLKSVDDEPDAKGLLWGQADLTDDTRALVAAKKLRYVSPFLDWSQRDKKTGEPQGLTFTSIALTNRPFLDAMPAVALSEWVYGTGGEAVQGTSEWDAVNTELSRRVKETMAEKGLAYGAAMQALMLNDRDLWHRYNAERLRQLGSPTVSGLQGDVASEIHRLATEMLAASEVKMDYGTAYKRVLNERPDLARRWKDAIR